MPLGVELLLVGFIAILPSVYSSLLWTARPARLGSALAAFTGADLSINLLLRSLGGIAAVTLVARDEPEGLASVGLRLGTGEGLGESVFNSLLLGGLALALLLLVANVRWLLTRGKAKVETESHGARLSLLEINLQRDGLDRLLYATVLPYAALAEEITYRGYLVLLMGQRTGLYSPWIATSILLSIVLHLYQGLQWATVLRHAAFAGLFIWLSLMTGGIEGPTILHAYLNLAIAVRAWGRGKPNGAITAAEVRSPLARLGTLALIAVNVMVLLGGSCSLGLILR